MDELLLPVSIRQKASVSAGGEHAWRQTDVEEAIRSAREVGLACLGGQVQFQQPDGTCEAYWLTLDPQSRRDGEPWQDYVSRSADEALDGFRRLCRGTDFQSVAREWELIRTKIDREAYDPVRDLWFVLYFATESTLRTL